MSNVSSAYKLSETLHSSLFNSPENQARGRIFDGEVRADISEPYGTERLTIFGVIEGRRAHQHLSRSQRNGNFYLSTVFTEPGGEVLRTHITEDAPEEMISIVAETLFMQAIQRASETR